MVEILYRGFIKAQSDILAIVILTGLAIVIGIGLANYYTSVSSQYRDRLNTISILQQEYYSQIIRFVANDQNYAWFIALRVDGSRKQFYIAIDNGSMFLSCNKIQYYVNEVDNNDAVCSSAEECQDAEIIGFYPINKVYVLYGNDVVDLRSFLRVKGVDIPDSIRICRVEQSKISNITWIRISLDSSMRNLRIYSIVFINNVPYIVRIFEYNIGLGV